MPRLAAELRLGRMRRLLRRLGDPQDGTPDHPRGRDEGEGLDLGDDRRRAVGGRGPDRPLLLAPPARARGAVQRSTAACAAPEELVALTDAVRPVVAELDASDPHPRHRGLTFFEITTAMGLLHFARRAGRGRGARGGAGGPARLDQRRPPGRLGHHLDLLRPHPLARPHPGRDRRREGGHPQAGPARGQRRAGPEAARRDRADRPAARGCRCASSTATSITTTSPPASPPRPAPGRPGRGRYLADRLGHARASPPRPAPGAQRRRGAGGLDVLAEDGLVVGRDDAVVRGFAALRWPARVEVLGESPLARRRRRRTTSPRPRRWPRPCGSAFPRATRTLVFGTTRDKDLRGQLRRLAPRVRQVIATRYVENPRSVPPEEIAAAVLELDGRTAQITADPAEALALAAADRPRRAA